MVIRDRDINLQLGHIIRLDKVVNIAEMGAVRFEYVTFPHKVSWVPD